MAQIEIRETSLAGVLLVTPSVYRDGRGFFLEAFNQALFEARGLPTRFVQDNHSRSSEGVLRGLHYQIGKAQGKLVRAVRGRIFDVAVDVRRGSPTFGKWVGETLDDLEMRMLWVPPGFAHGFCALSPDADVVYKCTELYEPASERGVIWNDPEIGIDWPVSHPRLSAKDAAFQSLESEATELPDFA